MTLQSFFIHFLTRFLTKNWSGLEKSTLIWHRKYLKLLLMEHYLWPVTMVTTRQGKLLRPFTSLFQQFLWYGHIENIKEISFPFYEVFQILKMFKNNLKLTREAYWRNSKISNRDNSTTLMVLCYHYFMLTYCHSWYFSVLNASWCQTKLFNLVKRLRQNLRHNHDY